MLERPRLLVLDLLETYARERDVDVRLERRHERHAWTCVLDANNGSERMHGRGGSAREAIMNALTQAGIELPG